MQFTSTHPGSRSLAPQPDPALRAGAQLLAFVGRVEHLERLHRQVVLGAERFALVMDHDRRLELLDRCDELHSQLNREIEAVYGEIRTAGYDDGAVRRVIHRRAWARTQGRPDQTLDQLLATYRRALGPVGR